MAGRTIDARSARSGVGGSLESSSGFIAERTCAGCGYNLRGLKIGAACPECGLPTSLHVERTGDDALSRMPQRIIVAFTRGCWLATLVIVGALALAVATQFPAFPQHVHAWASMALAAIWLVAALWLTPAFEIQPAVSRGFTRTGRLRLAVRFFQLGWIAYAAAGVAALPAFNVSLSLQEALIVARIAGWLIGIIGLILLCILLQRLAEWTRDDDAERRFDWVIWGLPAAFGLSLLSLPVLFFNVFVGVLWVWSVMMLPLGLLSLSKSVTLSIVHLREHQDRLHRRAEREAVENASWRPPP